MRKSLNAISKAFSLTLCLLLILSVVPAAMAQTAVVGQTSVSLSFNIPTSASINCTQPNTPTASGLSVAFAAITCTSAWNLPASMGYGVGICIAQYFASATPFGAGGPASSAVSAAVNGGGATAFAAGPGFPSSAPCTNTLSSIDSGKVFGPNINSSTTEPLQGNETDTDVISVNLTGVPSAAYSGTLNFAIGLQ
jgi:hypothetical protein